MSQINLRAIFVQVSLKNSKLRLSTDVGISGNRRHRIPAILVKMMIWTYCGIRAASRTRFLWDRALIRLQMRIFLESAVTKLYENA